MKNRMHKKKLKKIIAVSGVVGAMLSAKTIPVNATTVNNSGVAVASVSKGQVVNVTSTLRVRSAANTNSTVLGTLRNGATFDIISKSGSWYEMVEVDLFMEIMLRKLQNLQQFHQLER